MMRIYFYFLPDGYAIQQQSNSTITITITTMNQWSTEAVSYRRSNCSCSWGLKYKATQRWYSLISKMKNKVHLFFQWCITNDDNGKVWTCLIDSIEPGNIIQVIKDNHEDQEENAKKVQDMENWLFSLQETKKWYHMK